jgi:tight adherence protein B
MLRNLSVLCFVAAAVLAFRGGQKVIWPRYRARMDRAERRYAAQLKELFRPVATARQMALAQYLGTLLLAVLILVATRNPVFALAIPVVGFLLPNFLLDRLRRQRLAKINHQLPDALRVMSDAAKAGLALPQMIRLVATQGPKPIAEEFGLVVHAMDLGESVEDALKRVGDRLDLSNFDLMSTAMIVNRDRGGDIGQLLVRLAEAIRAISDVEERIETETAAVRMSAKIMVGTIPLFGILLFFIDPAAVGMLFSTVLGAVVLVLVAGLATTGYRMILRLANPEI